MALPFFSMAWSINFPLIIRALELGKSETILGGRPMLSAVLKSAEVMELGPVMSYLLFMVKCLPF
jgi:hypothetical protein